MKLEAARHGPLTGVCGKGGDLVETLFGKAWCDTHTHDFLKGQSRSRQHANIPTQEADCTASGTKKMRARWRTRRGGVRWRGPARGGIDSPRR